MATNLLLKPDRQSLKAAADLYRKFLPTESLFVFDISVLDRVGIPIQIAALQTKEGFTNDGFGYGGDGDEALVGALGELTETYHTHQALTSAPACEGLSFIEMVDLYGRDAVVDPRELCLSAGYAYHENLPLRWVAVTRWNDGAACWAPRETVAPGGSSYETVSKQVEHARDGSPAQLFPAITCGLGAGTNLEQALAHGVLELLQRDGNCTRFRAMDQGIDLNLDKVESEEVRTLIDRLADLGLRVRAKLASMEFGLSNLYVIAVPIEGGPRRERFPLLATACGEAVHPNRERALRKALQEYISSRSRKCFMHGTLDSIERITPPGYAEKVLHPSDPDLEERKAIREMAGWLDKEQSDLREILHESVFASKQKVNFSDLPSVPDGAVADPLDRLADVTKRLSSEDISLYYFDATPEGSDAPRVVKTIAPKLEGETMSYWRIGYRGARRLLEQKSPLVHQRAPKTQDLPITLTEEAEKRLGGPVYFSVPEWEKIIDGHYPLYREPSSHTVQKFISQRDA